MGCSCACPTGAVGVEDCFRSLAEEDRNIIRPSAASEGKSFSSRVQLPGESGETYDQGFMAYLAGRVS